TASLDAEIIVVDSQSTDGSVDIARHHPVRIVQIAKAEDRRCGAIAQLGYQSARGRFVLLIDGDMELMPDFLDTALPLFAADDRLAGVGGQLIELSEGLEFRERAARGRRIPGKTVPHITGCALYRAAAIRQSGYLTNRNLHCFEEFELGLRLRRDGWRLQLLDVDCVRHHGHRDPPTRLLLRRWRTRFLHGHGELLRDAFRRPDFVRATAPCRIAILTVLWWVSTGTVAALAPNSPFALAALAVFPLLPFAVLVARKRSIGRAAYAFAMAQLSAASLIRGLLAHRFEPTEAVPAIVLKA
ncbi:MAG: glycosyltransferase, partial [Acetobacteraceae bacterium]|nr:glycosyltransferase [Acetobacteraceae bacterium]